MTQVCARYLAGNNAAIGFAGKSAATLLNVYNHDGL